jgi:hypothetical protein
VTGRHPKTLNDCRRSRPYRKAGGSTQTGRWCHEAEPARFDPSRIFDLDRPNQRLMTIADIRTASGSAKSQKLLRAVNPARCQRVIEDAHLGEQSGLIPIEMLVGDFASLELDYTG